MTTTDIRPTADPRAEYIAGLRVLADLLDANPDLRIPYDGQAQAPLMVMPHGDERAALAQWARALPGRKEKQTRDGYFDLIGSLRGLYIKVICHRDEVCEKVVTGTREVTEEVADPELLAAVPKVTVTKTVEDVSWVCRPILGDDTADTELAVV